ncbi:MAG: hypothetical protein ACJAWM_001889 [Sulfitobacter sp.]|jgi:hypothetical protein
MTRALMQYQPRGVGDAWFGGSQCSTMGGYGPFVFLNTTLKPDMRYCLRRYLLCLKTNTSVASAPTI